VIVFGGLLAWAKARDRSFPRAMIAARAPPGCRCREQQRRQGLAQMPFDVVGEHAKKDVGANAIGVQCRIGRIRRSTVLRQRKLRSTRAKSL